MMPKNRLDNRTKKTKPSNPVALLASASFELLVLPLRFTNAAAILIHGFGHTLMLFFSTRQRHVFTVDMLSEGLGWAGILKESLNKSPEMR